MRIYASQVKNNLSYIENIPRSSEIYAYIEINIDRDREREIDRDR